MPSAATTSIVARSAIVRGLRSLSSLSTSSMVTLVGSGAAGFCCACAVAATAMMIAAASPSPIGLFILDLDSRHPANDEAVGGGEHEQGDGDRRKQSADDDH